MIKKQEDDDKTLFQKAMQGVKPLICDKEPLYSPPPLKRKKQPNNQEITVQNTFSEEYESLKYTDNENELSFVRPGVQHSILRKLKRSRLNIKLKLDLHGMTVAEAQVNILKFLYYCQRNDIRYASIIHGKGHSSQQKQGILKMKVNQWLREREEVLAFCSAQESDGGTGALYILIKRLQQKER
jgi:DNA-nicking Smr family endonuclease